MNSPAQKDYSKSSVNETQVKELLLQYPNASGYELCCIYNKTTDKKISRSAMFRALCRLGPRQPKEKDLFAEKFRLKVAQAYECGSNTQEEIAKLFNINTGTVAKYWQQYKKVNNIDTLTYGRSRKILVKEVQIKELVLQYPDATIEELRYIYNKTADKKINNKINNKIIFLFFEKNVFSS